MMMLPGMTASPPNFLTPRRRPAVSRPLRDEPPAFLCAMSVSSGGNGFGLGLGRDRGLGGDRERLGDVLMAVGGDAGDAEHGHVLAVAVLAAAVLAAALFEDDDLVEAVL